MYTRKDLILALQILEKYSNDDANPIFFDQNDLVIVNVETDDVSLLDKEKLLSLGFEEVDNYFRTDKYTFKYE